MQMKEDDDDDLELASNTASKGPSSASAAGRITAAATSTSSSSPHGHLAWGFFMGVLLAVIVLVPSLQQSKSSPTPAPDSHSLEALATTSAVQSLFASQASRQLAGLLYLNQTLALDLLRYSPAPSPAAATPLQAYLSLSRGFDAQRNQAYCGLASAATVLNSLLFPVMASPPPTTLPNLNVSVDLDPTYSPYVYATQADILGSCDVGSWVHRDSDYDSVLTPPYGLTLRQVGGVLSCHLPPATWTVTATPLDPISVSLPDFRSALLSALSSSPLSRVVVNFRRTELGQAGGGHWSPVAGYDAGTDSFLVLDVAKYKLPPFFVAADALHRALATVDECGVWNWPDAQATLTAEERTTGTMTQGVKDKLGCKPSYRGFITVTPNVLK